MTNDDYQCRKCGAMLYVPDGEDPLDEDVRYCTECAVGEIESLRKAILDFLAWENEEDRQRPGFEAEWLEQTERLAEAAEAGVDYRVLKAEVKRLRAALAPFAAVGRTIPRDWPSTCRLREDAEYRSPETGQARGKQGWHQWLDYWGVHDGGSLPTIVEWRAAAEAVETTKPPANP